MNYDSGGEMNSETDQGNATICTCKINPYNADL